MRITPVTHEGYKLLHDGVVALSQVEANGMRVDTAYLERSITEMEADIAERTRRLKSTKEWELWKRTFGHKAKFGSDDQLAHLLYKKMGYVCTDFTDEGKSKMDESALSKIDLPFIKDYVRFKKSQKILGTYLRGIQRETCDGYLHPVFNLHIARTYRSSSDSPNFQNMPIRNPEMGKIIRRCFIPRKGHVIVENDYSGVEVRVAACYHKDPRMLTYIKDPTKDMHRDMAAQIYKLLPEQVQKNHRYCGKNKFVFPQFYGDYYINSARSMWEAIGSMKLQGPNGEPLDQWLAAQGINGLGALNPKEKPKKGTFEHHMKAVEDDFWNNRFKVYGQWKRNWWESYLKEGGFTTYTGFRIDGVLSKNDVINYPVQGAAFHCLLWSVIQINRILKKNKMRSVVVGQIHDSCVGDVHTEELADYLDIVREVMTERITKQFPWLIVPLDIENEITPVGATWYEKQEVSAEDGVFSTKLDGDKDKSKFDNVEDMLAAMSARYQQNKKAA